jgi:hypothetical protein
VGVISHGNWAAAKNNGLLMYMAFSVYHGRFNEFRCKGSAFSYLFIIMVCKFSCSHTVVCKYEKRGHLEHVEIIVCCLLYGSKIADLPFLYRVLFD